MPVVSLWLMIFFYTNGAVGDDFDQQFLDVEVVAGEVLLELAEFVRAVGVDGLFHRVVEELFDESGLGFVAGGDELGEVFDAFEFFDGAGFGEVAACGIDGVVLVMVAVAADGVEVFHCEAERIDHAVATLAGFGLRLQGNALARAEVSVDLGG